jgi:hypothetical protein
MSIHMRKKELAIVGRCMRDVYQGPIATPKTHSEYRFVVLGCEHSRRFAPCSELWMAHSTRPLWTFPLEPAVISELTRAGYTVASDVQVHIDSSELADSTHVLDATVFSQSS